MKNWKGNIGLMACVFLFVLGNFFSGSLSDPEGKVAASLKSLSLRKLDKNVSKTMKAQKPNSYPTVFPSSHRLD